MPLSRDKRLGAMLGSIVWPVLWGGAACFAFYAFALRGPFELPLVKRYFAGHPVAFAAATLFFIGVAALILKLMEVLGQIGSLGQVRLAAAPAGGNRVGDCEALLRQLDKLPLAVREGYLDQRLNRVITNVQRKGTSEGLEDELKYQADMDSMRQQESYALVSLVIWATPMLGFLGTVIGITQALGDLDFQIAGSIESAMDGLLSGLYVAFDTTALALSLSILLMLFRFVVERLESQLMARVDSRAEEELVGRFQSVGGAKDPHVASIEQMSHAVVENCERLVQRQAELWQTTIDAAHQQWSQLVGSSGEQLHTAFADSLGQTLEQHATRLTSLLVAADENARQHWLELDARMAQSGERLDRQQASMERQGEMMVRAIEAVGEVTQLEAALADNLTALSGAHHFEETVMSLSAAIHLLNTRLGGDIQRDKAIRDDTRRARRDGGGERAA